MMMLPSGLATAAVTVCALLLTGCNAAEEARLKEALGSGVLLQTYQNDTYGAQIFHPDSWPMEEKRQDGGVVAHFYSPEFRMVGTDRLPKANIALQFIPNAPIGRTALFDRLLANETALSALPLVSRTKADLGGEDAIMEVAEGDSNGQLRKVVSWITEHRGTIYSLQVGADSDVYERYEPIFTAVVEKFTFTAAR